MGCGPENPSGLRLAVYRLQEEVYADVRSMSGISARRAWPMAAQSPRHATTCLASPSGSRAPPRSHVILPSSTRCLFGFISLTALAHASLLGVVALYTSAAPALVATGSRDLPPQPSSLSSTSTISLPTEKSPASMTCLVISLGTSGRELVEARKRCRDATLG